MPERKLLLKVAKNYDMTSETEYYMHLAIYKILSYPVKEDAIREYESLEPKYKQIIEAKIASMR